jgi:ABC-2 type transport system ATP-binding protein
MSTTLEFQSLTKHFGNTHAVNDLSFTVSPGRVTGFLGPNGSGKSTSLRCLTGLVTPTSGRALINGERYQDLPNPSRIVGAALEATGFHPGRSGFDTLAVMTDAMGLPSSAAYTVLEQVGMSDSSTTKVGAYSLGMKQRLALAAALLGDPEVLVLDEPANGLDPEGIAWLRNFLQFRATQGGTILVSSHVLSEVQQTVDDVVIISRGRLVKACSLEELVAETQSHVEVITPEASRFAEILRQPIDGASATEVRLRNLHIIEVEGLTAAVIGRAALAHRIELHGLAEHRTDLEDVFLKLTGDSE